MKLQIGPLRAESANLLANDFVAGLPSPGAALGFAGALLRHAAGIKDWSHKVFFVLHSVECRRGRPRTHPKVEYGILKNEEIMEGLTGNVVFTLVVDTPHFISAESMSRALNFMRFAGGVLVPTQSLGSYDALTIEQRIVSVDPNAILADLGLPRGYALVPPYARDDADIISFGDFATLCKLRNRAYARRTGQGLCVPVSCGYRLLEDPRTAVPRPGSRGGHPHIFGEPAVGIGEFVSIRSRSLPSSVSELDHCMWSWSCDFDRRLLMFSPTHLGILTQDFSR